MKTIVLFSLVPICISPVSSEQANVDVLLRRAGAGDLYERGKAIAALGRSKDKKSVPFLLRTMKTGPIGLRFQAMSALAALGDTKLLFEHLPKLKDDPAPAIRHSAVKIIAGQYRTRDTAGYIAALVWFLKDEYQPVRGSVIESLLKKGAAGAKALVPAFADSDHGIRQRALRIFAKYSVPDAVPELIVLAADENSHTRVLALQALARQRNRDAVLAVKEALSAKDAKVRAA
ncbi:MAG: HEAT repeat domain-containing protein, partial [Planctomycetota bacterium]|nr:HEAT repeat domain-containing protein [Planctomycetota bacterium]